MRAHVTVGESVEGGWTCVDDAGRRVHLPRTSVEESLRDLRVGQRLRAEIVDGVVVRASLP